VGVLSMRDLIMARSDQTLLQIMIPRQRVRVLFAEMDQEEVANLFRRYHYLAMPVVDRQDRLLGLVTVDDIVDVIQEETTEDVHKLFGAGAEEKLTSPWHFSFRKRVGWLAVNLATAFVGAAIVAAFESTIAALAILAAFLPVVSAVGGNASVQAMAVTVRGLSGSGIDGRLILRVLARELKVGAVAGACIGAILFVIAVAYGGPALGVPRAAQLGLVVATALLANVTLGCLVGTSVPIIMHRIGFDPAQSATIFTTATTDAVGFLLLLFLAAVFLL
jgi:magnesium transporter